MIKCLNVSTPILEKSNSLRCGYIPDFSWLFSLVHNNCHVHNIYKEATAASVTSSLTCLSVDFWLKVKTEMTVIIYYLPASLDFLFGFYGNCEFIPSHAGLIFSIGKTSPVIAFHLSMLLVHFLLCGFLEEYFSDSCSTTTIRSTNGVLAAICSVCQLRPALTVRRRVAFTLLLSLYPIHWLLHC